MNHTPNWDLVEDTLEHLMRSDGSFDRRVESGSHPSPGIKSVYGPVFLRDESSFATAAGGSEGVLAMKILAFANHREYGTVVVPIVATAFGRFEDCVAEIVTEQFHLHYLAIAGCLTASPHTTLFQFSLEGADGLQPWMAHSGRLIVNQEGGENLYHRVSSAGIEAQLLNSIASEMSTAAYHRVYISGEMSRDGVICASVLLDDQKIPEAALQAEAMIRPIFEDLGEPGHFRRFLILATGTPIE